MLLLAWHANVYIRGTKNKGTPISVYFASERTMLHLTQLKPNPGPLAISVVTHRCRILYPSWFSRIMHCMCVVGYKLNTITGTSHCSENASTTIPAGETKMANNWDGAGGSVPESGGSILWKIGKSKSVISRLVTLHRQTGNVTMKRGRGRQDNLGWYGLLLSGTGSSLLRRLRGSSVLPREYDCPTLLCGTDFVLLDWRQDVHSKAWSWLESPTSMLPMGSTPPDTSFASLASCHAFRRIQVLSEVYRWT